MSKISTDSKRKLIHNGIELSCYQDEVKNNQKKMKTFHESSGNSITLLNQYGFDEVLVRNNEKAEMYFLDAIALLPKLEIQITETFQSKIDDPLFITDAIDNNLTTEYDEGFNPDSFRPIQIEISDDNSMKSSILMYNIGLTHILRRDFATSLNWFDRSLNSLVSSNTERNIAMLSVKVIHAIGLCKYRLNKHCESIMCYVNALSQIKEITDEKNEDVVSELLAYTNNALAVVMLRSMKDNADATNIAIQLFQESLKLYDNLDRSDKLQSIATVFNNTGQAHYKNGQYEQASVAYEASLKIRRHLKN